MKLKTKGRNSNLWLALFLSSYYSILIQDSPSIAQIIPDDTLGSEASVVNQINETLQQIDGGALRGENLFHSFLEFSINEGNGVYFSNPIDVINIFSRVTGNNISQILGTLGVSGDANLYFVNPNGILFGPNAQLDIAGSFVASSGSGFIFPNGMEYSATNPQSVPLLTVNATAPVGLRLEGSEGIITNQAQLTAGNNLTLAGNQLDLQGQILAQGDLTLQALDQITIRDSINNPFIALSGKNLLVQGNQKIDIFALNHPHSGLFAGENLTLRSPSTIAGDARYWSGGDFRVEQLDGNLGNLNAIEDPIIRSEGDVSFNNYQGTSLHILAGGSVDLGIVVITGTDTEADTINPTTTPTLANISLSDGTSLIIDGNNRPTLDVRAGVAQEAIGEPLGTMGDTFPSDVFLDTSNTIISSPENNPVATSADIIIDLVFIEPSNGVVFLTNQYQPNLSLSGGDITISGSEIFSPSLGIWTSGGDNAGDVIIDSRGSITLDGGVIAESVFGNGGNITLLGDGDITLKPGVSIGSVGLLGGNITLNSKKNISITGGSIVSDSTNKILTEPTPTGGDLNVISSRSLFLTDGARISAISSGQVNAGSVILNIGDTVSLDGINSQISTEVPPITFGNAGNIEITTGSLSVTNGAQLKSENLGQGDTGSIRIFARELVVFDKNSSAESKVGDKLRGGTSIGDAGDIEITTGSLFVTNDSRLESSVFGEGNAGRVRINATNSVLFSDSDARSNVKSWTEVNNLGETENKKTIGNSGGIEIITTGSLFVTNGASLTSSTQGKGNSGGIKITATGEVIFDGEDDNGFPSRADSQVNKDAMGNSGGIDIQANSLKVTNGGVLDAGTFGRGNAGSVKLKANDSVLFDGEKRDGRASGVLSQVNSRAIGNAGEINISTKTLSVLNGAEISASTFSEGNSGNLKIVADNSVIFDGERKNGRASRALSAINSRAVGNGGNIEITTGSLFITNGAQLNVNADGKGNSGIIKIIATDEVVLDGEKSNGSSSSILSQVGRDAIGDAKGIEITTGSLFVTNGARLSSSTSGQGNAGSLTIIARDSVVFDGEGKDGNPSDASTQVNREGVGNAGEININTGSLSVINGARLSSVTFGEGNAGDLTINARENIFLDGERSNGLASFVFSQVEPTVTGNGGDINIRTGSLFVTNGSQISSRITDSAQGNAGKITIIARENIVLDGKTRNGGLPSSVSAGIGIGAIGEVQGIELITDSLSVINGAAISTSTFGQGDAGIINIIANKNVLFEGENSGVFSTGGNQNLGSRTVGSAGEININTPELIVNQGASISAFTEASGDSGTISINAPQAVLLTDNSEITVETRSAGNAKEITIITPLLTIGENAQLSATATETSTAETAGDINLNVNQLNISGRLGIFAETQSTPTAGSLTIQPYQNNPDLNIKFITGDGFISARTGENSSGEGGNISITAPETINISGLGSITAETSGEGNAGNINIDTANLTIAESTNITTSTESSGNAGLITLNATESIFLTNQAQITSEVREGGKGTSEGIVINTPILNISDRSQISALTSGSGNAGDIIIETNNLNISNGVEILALTTGAGNAGSIEINNGENNNSNQVSLTNSTISTIVDSDESPEDFEEANITINANNLFLDNSTITAKTNSNNELREAGNIKIPSAQNINLINNSKMIALTEGTAKAGDIDIIVEEEIKIDSGSALDVETKSCGEAGNIDINADILTIGEDAELSARTTDEGIAGNITLNTNQLNISGELGIFAETEGEGKGGNLIINPQINHPDLQINFSNEGKISASTLGSGDGGDINITAPLTINIDGNGSIKVETQGEGNAGDIEIVTQNLNLTGGIEITASTLVDENTTISNIEGGNAGNIILDANNINLDDSQINAFTNSTGNAGNINLYYRQENSNNITLTNSTISTEIRNNGVADEASNIIIKTNNLTADNSTITASTIGVGDAGEINLFTQQLELNNSSKINAFSDGIGSGGSIEISNNGNNNQSVRLTNNSEISTEIKGNGEANQASDITIKTHNLTADNSTITASTIGIGDAGNINILNSQQITLDNGKIISTTSGIGDTGEINLSATDTINLNNNSEINSSVEAGGMGNSLSINLTTPQLTLSNNSTIKAETAGEGNAGTINLTQIDNLSLNNGSKITTEITSTGNANQRSNINITANQINLNQNAEISASNNRGNGDAGNITLTSQQLELNNSSKINAFTDGMGSGGSIEISDNGNQNQSVRLTNNSEISTEIKGNGEANQASDITIKTNNLISNDSTITASTQGKGNAGNITIADTQQIELNNSQISTETNGKGNAGQIMIPDIDILYLNDNSKITTAIAKSGIATQPSNIEITASQVFLNNNSQITASTDGQGKAGSINLNIAEDLTLNKNSIISSAAEENASKDGGNITIKTPEMNLNNQSKITVNSDGLIEANAGEININSESITLNNKSQISGSTSAGQGGNLNLNAQKLTLENDSQIITTTSGKSQAGNINLIIGEQVIISGFETGILADTTSKSTGKGGNIDLKTPELLIENGGIIAVDSSGEGEGGVIKIYNQNLTLNKGRISAETRSGDGGDINLTVQEFLTMRNGSKISTTAGNEQTGGNGGNINIFARDIWAIPEENSDITANAFTGKGGQISITTETIFGIEPRNELTSLSDITASSELGVDGIIEITRLNVDPLEGLTNLPETRAEVQVAQGCEVGGEGNISFYDLGLGGLPAQPTYFFRSKPIPWIPLINQKETQQQSWGLTDKTYSVFPATTPIQFKFSCQ